jgi:hypothetical protein
MEQKLIDQKDNDYQFISQSNTIKLLTQPRTLNQLLYNKYGEITEDYNNLYLDALVYSKNSHIFTSYKDNLIWNYIDEFLKRYYSIAESAERLPRISNYYKNYLKFFCSPMFRNFKLNDLIQTYGDNKAEIYYKKTYSKKQKEKDAFNENLNDNSEGEGSDKSAEKKNFSTIFNTTIKQNIDQNILTESARADSLNFSSVVKYDCLTRRSREDSIEKLLSSFGEDMNERFMNKLGKNALTKKSTYSMTTKDRTDKTTHSTKGKGKSTSTPNKVGTKAAGSTTTKTASVSPFHNNYVGNIINVVNIGVNMGNVGVNLVGNSIGINGINTVTKTIKGSEFNTFYSNFNNVTTRAGNNNKVSLCSIYKANPWQQIKPVIKTNENEANKAEINKKHTINDFRKKKHSSMYCESQRVNSSIRKTNNNIENMFKCVKRSYNSQIAINSPKEQTNTICSGKKSPNLIYSKSPPSSAKIKLDKQQINQNRSISNANFINKQTINPIHKRDNSSKFSNFLECSQKLLTNFKSPTSSIITTTSRNNQSNLLKLASNPLKNSIDVKHTNLQEFLKNQKSKSKSKIENKSQSRKSDISSRILHPTEDKKRSIIEQLPIKEKTKKIINLYAKTMNKK